MSGVTWKRAAINVIQLGGRENTRLISIMFYYYYLACNCIIWLVIDNSFVTKAVVKGNGSYHFYMNRDCPLWLAHTHALGTALFSTGQSAPRCLNAVGPPNNLQCSMIFTVPCNSFSKGTTRRVTLVLLSVVFTSYLLPQTQNKQLLLTHPCLVTGSK